MTTAEEHKSNGIGKDLGMYVCLLVLAGLQFVIAYQNINASQMLTRMLAVACLEAGWQHCSSCIFGRRSGPFCCLLPSLRFLSCWGCNMDGPTAPGWWRAHHFQVPINEGDRMLRGKMRVERPFLLIGIVLVTLAILAALSRPSPELRALLYAGRVRGARMIQALRSGILILIVPPTFMSVGMIFIVNRKRNQFRQVDYTPESDRNR